MQKSIAAALLVLLSPALALSAEPTRDEVLAAMKKATTFMTGKVALNGGYVWLVSENLDRRWGEIPARPSQIWLQGGTERVGKVLLHAYEATHDEIRSEEHTSELQSLRHLVCRLLLEKKKKKKK